MHKIFFRRIVRDLKINFLRYFALFFLIFLGMYMVISIVGSADAIRMGVMETALESKVEDGQFRTFMKIEQESIQNMKSDGVEIEAQFYLDYSLDKQTTIRIYKNREEVNKVVLEEGALATKEFEIVLEKQFAKKNNYKVMDKIEIGKELFTITGIGSSSDYDSVLKNMSDTCVESKLFGTGFVCNSQYDRLVEAGNFSKSEEYTYAYRLSGKMTGKEFKETYLEKDKKNVIEFTEQENNPRIGASTDDVYINKIAGIIAGVIIMILFTYVISVFIIYGIEKDSTVIGTLYALGEGRKNLLLHYLTLPVLITFFGSVCGMIVGFSELGVGFQIGETANYFSFPKVAVRYPFYLVLYGSLMPPVIAFIVNILVIYKKLSQPALHMIHKETKKNKMSNLKLEKFSFVTCFQIRQFMREIRSSITVIVGIFIALLILIMGINCYVLCINMSNHAKKDTVFEYMYYLKIPTEKVVPGGEACYLESLKKEANGFLLDVSLIGIDQENPYFNAEVKKGKQNISISKSVATKFNLDVGDSFVLADKLEEKEYTFIVDEIVPYSVGLYVFMDLNEMRSLFDRDKNYYNVVFSDHKLNIEPERLYATTTKNDIVKSSEVFIHQMKPLVFSLIGVSAIMILMVMYLMLKVMMDRSSIPISLMKILGYRKNEIRKLYLDGTFLVILITTGVSIPVAKWIMDQIYPFFVANIASGMDLTVSISIYILIYMGIIICYAIVHLLLTKRINDISPVDIIKNRE